MEGTLLFCNFIRSKFLIVFFLYRTQWKSHARIDAAALDSQLKLTQMLCIASWEESRHEHETGHKSLLVSITTNRIITFVRIHLISFHSVLFDSFLISFFMLFLKHTLHIVSIQLTLEEEERFNRTEKILWKSPSTHCSLLISVENLEKRFPITSRRTSLWYIFNFIFSFFVICSMRSRLNGKEWSEL